MQMIFQQVTRFQNSDFLPISCGFFLLLPRIIAIQLFVYLNNPQTGLLRVSPGPPAPKFFSPQF